MGTGEHFTDEGKLSNFKDYKILYDVTANASSGTGAKPEDNLFPQQDALSAAEGLSLNPLVSTAEAAVGKATDSATKGISSALGLGK